MLQVGSSNYEIKSFTLGQIGIIKNENDELRWRNGQRLSLFYSG